MAGSAYVSVVFDVPLDTSFTYRNTPENSAVLGVRVMAPFGAREALGYVVEEADAPPEGLDEARTKAVRRVVDQEPLFGAQELDLARWVAGYYLCSLGEALAAMIPSGRRESAAPAFADEFDAAPLRHELSEEQRVAIEAVMAEGPPCYLYGVTGSGKTEVFLQAAERILAGGKSVIYLVPEIALTHQVVESVHERFGAAAATLHSGMTPSQRLAEWKRIRSGEARIVVGPRSAVFAPLRNPGLIIIDEEHDGSYKSGAAPRYHARQVAQKRALLSGARLVMGSATPSAEAWKLMGDGALRRLDLTRRLSGGAPPTIELVSLAGVTGCLSPTLVEEIRATAAAGRQTILFLNRRGFTHFYRCNSCGYELSCKHCSVSLTYHKDRGRAVCHYCGYSEVPPTVCPQCGSLDAGYRGFGTELIEEEVRRTFPDLRIRRADADSTSRKGSLIETLAVFKAGGIDVLLGTQMVAKGLNFPGVRLVGVVLADTGLHLPDFRAAERTFSLIVQVAGRAGRYFPDGRVVVQTYRPQDQAIRMACALDAEGFYRSELEMRRILGFPPYARLVRLVLRSKDAARADAAARSLARYLAPWLPGEAEILGPAECPLSFIAGNARRQILLRSPTLPPLHGALRRALPEWKGERNVHLEIDVDPVSLL